MRKSLVRKLIEKGINNERVLGAVQQVPRHYFFDNAFVEHAYQDKAFPIGEGQTISQPYTVAFQSNLCEVKPGDRVLEIGTGSGYQACILMELGADLHTIEYKEKLSAKAKKMLHTMGYHPKFYVGDGSKGLPQQAPFDAILVTAGAPTVPEELIRQLAPGGKLVIPVGDRSSQKMLRIAVDKDGNLVNDVFNNFSFVPLVGEHGWN